MELVGGIIVMSKKLSRLIAVIMSIVAIIFFIIAISNPQASFPWRNTITYIIYAVYILVTIILFIAPFKTKQ